MPPIAVVVAVIRDGDRIWVQRRREPGPLDGCWEFPGGKPRPDEDDAIALRREVHEETGATIEVGDVIGERSHAYADREVFVRFFAASLAPGSPAPSADESAWLTPAELLGRPIPDANRGLVRRLAEPSP